MVFLSVLFFSLSVIDVLQILSITHSSRGISKVKGHAPNMSAWRFRCRAPHLTLPLDVYRRLVREWRGSLSLYLVGQQARDSAATLLSLSTPGNTPLLRIISNTQEDFLQLEIRTEPSTTPKVLRFPGGNPFSGGRWARVVLGVAPGRVWLFEECKEATVMKLSHQGQPLTLYLPPLDPQVTVASSAEEKASKFSVSLNFRLTSLILIDFVTMATELTSSLTLARFCSIKFSVAVNNLHI